MLADCICGSHFASDQNTFMMTYGGTGDEEGRKLIIRSDGNIQIAGWTNSFGITHDDIYTLVIDECGQVLCSSTNGGNRGNLVERGLSLVEIEEHSFPNRKEMAICGRVNTPAGSNHNFYVYNTEFENCNLDRSNRLIRFDREDVATDITTYDDGGDWLVFTGFMDFNPKFNIYIYKFDPFTGVNQLFHHYGLDHLNERGEGIVAFNRMYYVAGGCEHEISEFQQSSPYYSPCVLAVNYYTGAINYFYRYPLDSLGYLYDIEYTSESGLNPTTNQPWPEGFVVTGFALNSIGGCGYVSNYDVLVMRIDLSGNPQWVKTFGGCNSREEGHEIIVSSDSNFIVTGLRSLAGDFDGFLLKLSPNGDLIMANKFGGDGEDRLYSVKQMANEDFLACGWSNSFSSGDKDLFVIRTDIDFRIASSCYDTIVWLEQVLDPSPVSVSGQDTMANLRHGRLIDSVITTVDTICFNCN